MWGYLGCPAADLVANVRVFCETPGGYTKFSWYTLHGGAPGVVDKVFMMPRGCVQLHVGCTVYLCYHVPVPAHGVRLSSEVGLC